MIRAQDWLCGTCTTYSKIGVPQRPVVTHMAGKWKMGSLWHFQSCPVSICVFMSLTLCMCDMTALISKYCLYLNCYMVKYTSESSSFCSISSRPLCNFFHLPVHTPPCNPPWGIEIVEESQWSWFVLPGQRGVQSRWTRLDIAVSNLSMVPAGDVAVMQCICSHNPLVVAEKCY